jgi:succinate dehydrogenase / fumarate reductase iron-sulfur subunit
MRNFHIYRYDPDSGAPPRMQTFTLEPDRGMRMLLDALIALIALIAVDPSLSLRRSLDYPPVTS